MMKIICSVALQITWQWQINRTRSILCWAGNIREASLNLSTFLTKRQENWKGLSIRPCTPCRDTELLDHTKQDIPVCSSVFIPYFFIIIFQYSIQWKIYSFSINVLASKVVFIQFECTGWKKTTMNIWCENLTTDWSKEEHTFWICSKICIIVVVDCFFLDDDQS